MAERGHPEQQVTGVGDAGITEQSFQVALQTGAGDSIDLGGDVFQGGVALLHTPGSSSTGVGLGALAAVSSGDLNTALGRSALGSTTVGAGNTAIGTYTLDANTTGSNNTAVGRSALGANVTGPSNTAV